SLRCLIVYGSLKEQSFSKVDARSDCSRQRRLQAEEGAGGGLRPPPAPSSAQRLACEPLYVKRQRLRSPVAHGKSGILNSSKVVQWRCVTRSLQQISVSF